MCRVFLFLFLIIVTASSSVAQTANDFAPFKYMPEIPGALVLDGSLDFRSPLAFRRALQAHPETQLVVLQSDGGSVQAGLLIAEEIHDRKLKTLIPENSRCASACSFVFFAGVGRLAQGQLGVHQISGSEDLESTQLNLSDIIETLSKYDVSSDVITRMLRTPPADIYVFSPAELAALKINMTPEDFQRASLPATQGDSDASLPSYTQEEKAKAFVLGVITASSLPKADLLTLASNIYSDSIAFYGSVKSKSDVLQDKATYADRWPMRSSIVQLNTVSANCVAERCRVNGAYDWRVFDPKRKKQAAGSALFSYEVEMGATLRIVSEEGSVTSRVSARSRK
ncbi:hypothetical protein [Rhizobium sp. 2MFCol3.1]|uniref:COG3904 family protein n=1 Tax=Rhizobium sp. 2MFCol3.1 TaxID=1246459 RepID=UPI00035E0C14|nr:hypothetical protein [Rhizobium sp. 2MFCol3.1]